MNSLTKYPSAWVPVALSLAVLGTMLTSFTIFGLPVREPDEGVAAHLFQLWLFLEMVMIAFFAVTWLPQKPAQSLLILAVRVVAVLAGCAPVFYFNL